MKTGVFHGIIWTLALAIPFTALSVGILIFMNDLLPDIVRSIQFPSIDWRGLSMEGSARWPEIAGMIVGQLVILALIPISRTLIRLREET